MSSSLGLHLAYSTVEIRDGLSRFTDDSGRVSLQLGAAGSYRLKVKHLGYAPLDTTGALEPNEARRSITIILHPSAIRISTISVVAADKYAPGRLVRSSKRARGAARVSFAFQL